MVIPKSRILAYAWTAIIFALLSVQVDTPYQGDFSLLDKMGHILIFILWVYLWLHALKIRTWKHTLFIACIGILYGGIMEVWQGYIGRSPEVFDLLANGIGIGIGIILYGLTQK